MARFRGNHPAKIDEKGRLKLPSAFKSLLETDKVSAFYITSADGKRAEIWPLPEWEKVEDRLDGISSLDASVAQYMDLVNYYGQEVEIDTQGRLLMPQILREKAQLDGDVVVIGMRNHLAVHNREAFEQALPDEGLTEENRRTMSAILSERG